MTPFNGFSLGFAASLTGLDWVGLGVICSIASEPRPASKIGHTPSAPLAIEIAAERREKEWDANERGWRLVAGVVSFIFFRFWPWPITKRIFRPISVVFFGVFWGFQRRPPTRNGRPPSELVSVFLQPLFCCLVVVCSFFSLWKRLDRNDIAALGTFVVFFAPPN